MLCVLAASAVSYENYYKGTPQRGVIYTTSSVDATTIGTGGGIASAPVATMGSTSMYSGRGVDSNVSQITGMRTTAPYIIGGVTALKEEGEGGSRGPSVVEHGGHIWVWHEELGEYVCSKCGAEEEDYRDYDGPCVPLEFDWKVWAFLAGMAIAYMVYKTRESHRTETSVMRT